MDACFSWFFSMFLPTGVPYEIAKQQLHSFDLVYFCQMSKWTAPFITFFSGKFVTHMGMIWKDPTSGELYLFESVRNQDTSQDVASGGRVHAGVRLVSFAEKINRPTESYFICVQSITMTDHKRREAEPRLYDFIRRYINTPFEQNPTTIVRSCLSPHSYGYTPEDTTSMYCSELMALALRECRLLSIDNVSGVWITAFWSCKLMLNSGAQLMYQKLWIQMCTASVTTFPSTPAAITSKPPPPTQTLATRDEFMAELMQRLRVHYSESVRH